MDVEVGLSYTERTAAPVSVGSPKEQKLKKTIQGLRQQPAKHNTVRAYKTRHSAQENLRPAAPGDFCISVGFCQA